MFPVVCLAFITGIKAFQEYRNYILSIFHHPQSIWHGTLHTKLSNKYLLDTLINKELRITLQEAQLTNNRMLY